MTGETILFDPAANKFCVLNRSAAFIWDRIETPQTADNLVLQLTEAFEGAAESDVQRDVREVLQHLAGMGLIVAS